MNQLIGFTDGETTASYKYNASGLRYEKTVNGETINHVWDGSKQIIADVINNQFYEADCYIRGTNLVAKYNYKNGEKSEYTYYTQNAHGDVVNLTDKDGKVTKNYTYDAFGVEKDIDDSDTNAFRYCGEYYDKETATVYLRARNYNPSTGRFTQRDSFEGKYTDLLSLNKYTYCHNNPLIYMDPSGYKIQLTGSNEDKDAVLSEMQKLTDHKLAYNKKGDVYISEFAYAYNLFFKSIDGRKIPKNSFDAKYLAGNQLIEGMIDSKNTTSIVVDRSISNGYTDLLDEENASKSGSDTTIIFNPDFSPEMFVQIPRSKELDLERTDPFLVLAHEMIHADRAMRGNYITEGKAYQHAFFSRYSKFLWFEYEVYKYEPIAMEEAQTVGFVSSFSITENMIREEHGINLRGRYTLD